MHGTGDLKLSFTTCLLFSLLAQLLVFLHVGKKVIVGQLNLFDEFFFAGGHEAGQLLFHAPLPSDSRLWDVHLRREGQDVNFLPERVLCILAHLNQISELVLVLVLSVRLDLFRLVEDVDLVLI